MSTDARPARLQRIGSRLLVALAVLAVATIALFLAARVGVMPAASAGDDVWYDDSAWWLLHEGHLARHIHDNTLGDAQRDFLPPLTALFTAAAFALFGPTQFAVGIVPTACATAAMAMLALALRRRLRTPWPLAAGLATVPLFTPDLLKVAGHNRFEAEVFLFVAAGLLLAARLPARRAAALAAAVAAGLMAGIAIIGHYPVAPLSWGLVALWALAGARPRGGVAAFVAGTALAGAIGLWWIGRDMDLFLHQMLTSGGRYAYGLTRLPATAAIHLLVAGATLAATWHARAARPFAVLAVAAALATPWWPTTPFYGAVGVAIALAHALAVPEHRWRATALAGTLFAAVALVGASATATALVDGPARDYAAFTRNLRAVLPAREGLVLIDRAPHLALLPCYRAGQLHHLLTGEGATLPSRVLLDAGAVDRVAAAVLTSPDDAGYRQRLPLYRAFVARQPRRVRVSALGIGEAAGRAGGPYAAEVLLPVDDSGPRLATRCR